MSDDITITGLKVTVSIYDESVGEFRGGLTGQFALHLAVYNSSAWNGEDFGAYQLGDTFEYSDSPYLSPNYDFASYGYDGYIWGIASINNFLLRLRSGQVAFGNNITNTSNHYLYCILTVFYALNKLQNLYVNDVGTWKAVDTLYVNDGGTWKDCQYYVNDSGTWKKVYGT